MALKTRLPITLIAVGLGAAAAGIAYTASALSHRRPLRPALPGQKSDLATNGGRVALYSSSDREGPPLLLLHSINAAASAYEMRPLFMHFAGERPVYLPGYGLSERRKQTYTPRIMVDAIHAAISEIMGNHAGQPVDVMALSVSCEYAARAALERPNDFRTLGLISPTGFDKALAGYGRAQSTKGNALKLAMITVPVWSQALFDLVVSRPKHAHFS